MRLWLTEDGVENRKVKRTATQSLWEENLWFSKSAVLIAPMLLMSADSTVCNKTLLCAQSGPKGLEDPLHKMFGNGICFLFKKQSFEKLPTGLMSDLVRPQPQAG